MNNWQTNLQNRCCSDVKWLAGWLNLFTNSVVIYRTQTCFAFLFLTLFYLPETIFNPRSYFELTLLLRPFKKFLIYWSVRIVLLTRSYSEFWTRTLNVERNRSPGSSCLFMIHVQFLEWISYCYRLSAVDFCMWPCNQALYPALLSSIGQDVSMIKIDQVSWTRS